MAIRDGAGRIGQVILCMLVGAGCTDRGEPGTGERVAAQTLHHDAHYGGEDLPGPMNAFPADMGPVPHDPGSDLRPPAKKPTKPKTIARKGSVSSLIPAGGGDGSGGTGGGGSGGGTGGDGGSGGSGGGVSQPSEGTLVLFDDTGPWAFLGELYAMTAGNLASRFGSWSALRVADYERGDMLGYSAVIYIGSTYNQDLPVGFLDDVLSKQRPVVWMYDNIWQLVARAQGFANIYGFEPWIFDTSTVGSVVYKGATLTRNTVNAGGIMSYSALDPAKATVLASAVRDDGTTIPWAVRSDNLTYLGELPFTYMNETDRYLAFCDMLYDVLAPATPERHRALVRIEDVGADANPQALRSIADYLHSQNVPFGISLISVYVDSLGVYNNDMPLTVPISSAPNVLDAVKYMVSKGGKIVMHGYTHQYDAIANPYSGISADDFEFWRAHIDASDYVVYDGPVAEDSLAWATDRIDNAFQEIAAAGLPTPKIFEFPHYAGSALDSQAVAARFDKAWHRGLYFSGLLSGAPDYSHLIGQFFPYPVDDVYLLHMIPETLGAYSPVGYNHHPPRVAADIIAAAQTQRVVRDNVAGFYFHPYEAQSALEDIVEGIVAAGYTFADPESL